MNPIMTVYDIGYFLVTLLTLPFWLRYLFKKPYRQLLGRRMLPAAQGSGKPSVWLHAVSVGEVNSLLSLITDLTGQYPGYQVILTVTTPSGYQHALASAAGCMVLPAPLDFSFSIRRFISVHRPVLIVLNELEIWPNWLSIARKKGIPLLLINARLSDRAFHRYRRIRRLSRHMLSKISRILCQSDLHRERFIDLGVNHDRIVTIGHIKADEAHRLARTFPDRSRLEKELRILPTGAPRLLFASTHPEDEAVFTPLLGQLQKKYQLIIAPRHLQRIQALSEFCTAEKVAFHLWTDETPLAQSNPIILFDSMGKLPALMAMSDLVVMGGTFSARTGGHNLFEPLACGKLIIGGPHTENFADIARDLREKGLYFDIHDSRDLLNRLESITESEVRSALERTRLLLDQYCGSQTAIKEEISRCLPS